MISGDPITVSAYVENSTSTELAFSYTSYETSLPLSRSVGANAVELLVVHTTTSDAVPRGGDLVIDGRILVGAEVEYETEARDFEPWPERSTSMETAFRFVVTSVHLE